MTRLLSQTQVDVSLAANLFPFASPIATSKTVFFCADLRQSQTHRSPGFPWYLIAANDFYLDRIIASPPEGIDDVERNGNLAGFVSSNSWAQRPVLDRMVKSI